MTNTFGKWLEYHYGAEVEDLSQRELKKFSGEYVNSMYNNNN